MTLVTGSIWAKYRWGHWWLWSEKQLVLFLVLFLFYSAYFMLRFSVEPGPRQANLSAVYSLFGVVLIPISFLAIRLANEYIHPVAFTSARPADVGVEFFTFCVCLRRDAVVFSALYRLELAGQAARREPARVAGAARLSTEEKYVAAAYLVVFVVLLATC